MTHPKGPGATVRVEGRVGIVTSRHHPYGEAARYAVDVAFLPGRDDATSVWEEEAELLEAAPGSLP